VSSFGLLLDRGAASFVLNINSISMGTFPGRLVTINAGEHTESHGFQLDRSLITGHLAKEWTMLQPHMVHESLSAAASGC
jgi:hypothetical protein